MSKSKSCKCPDKSNGEPKFIKGSTDTLVHSSNVTELQQCPICGISKKKEK
jgi:hypothetical protein